MLRIGMVAGETSGDQLGASLITALKARRPDCKFEGMAGPRMIAAGCRAVARADELSVMGVVEVLRRYPALHALRERLVRHFLAHPPDIFIGIDVPDFVLGIERRLKNRGIKTVHYVCPQVWAWRESRAAKIARSVDLLLAIFPFEVAFFERHGVPVCFVGHPIADEIPIPAERERYRTELALDARETVIALLPGSRHHEVKRHTSKFIGAALKCYERRPNLTFLGAALDEPGAREIATQHQTLAPRLPLRVLTGQSRAALGASDAALVASGTVTMEAMFLKTPMVVAYRAAPVTYLLLKQLVRIPFIAMPNILAGRKIVPEFVQDQVKPDTLAQALLAWLDDPDGAARYRTSCAEMHRKLRRDAATRSADAVLSVTGANRGICASARLE